MQSIASFVQARSCGVDGQRCLVIQERDLDAEKLASLATSILRDLPTRERMAKAARALAIPDAAERVRAAIEATLSPT